MRPDPEELCILTLEANGKPEKYWTGKMAGGSWPEYLRDRERAHELPRHRAEPLAADFNRRMDCREDAMHWVVNPAVREARINGG